MDKHTLVQRLSSAGISPKKGLGQHFLVDDYYLRRIADSLPSDGDFYLEIGGGPATLSEKILEKGYTPYTIVEIDSSMVEILRSIAGNKATVVHADAATISFSTFGNNGVIFGNLPYNVGSKIIINTCVESSHFRYALFLLQQEVAEKCVAEPGTRNMGPLAALIRLIGRAEILFSIPPEAFYPPPKVISALLFIEFDRHSYSSAFLKAFVSTIRIIFSNRRKKLGNVLKINGINPTILEQTGISPSLRAEQLSWNDLQNIASKISKER